MGSTRRVRLRYAGALLLIALLLAPIVASAHGHTPHPSAQPCATCLATHHTPLLRALPVATVGAAPLVLEVQPVAEPRPLAPVRRSPTGRAPPSSLLSRIA